MPLLWGIKLFLSKQTTLMNVRMETGTNSDKENFRAFCKYPFGGYIKAPGGKESFGVRQLEFCCWYLCLTSRWLLIVPPHPALLSPLPRFLMVQLLQLVLRKPLVSPTPVLQPDARLLASWPRLACQPLASHHATSLGVVAFHAWWGTVLGARRGCSTAMRRRPCSSWMTDLPATWRGCMPWRRWMPSWNAGSGNNVAGTSHWCALIISVTSTPLKISNERSGVSLFLMCHFDNLWWALSSHWKRL